MDHNDFTPTTPRKQYPLHPGQTHASPLYTQLPLEEYEALMKENKALKQANANMAESIAELDAMRLKEVELDMRERELKENKFVFSILTEHKKAKEKFPVFCDDFTGARNGFVLDELEHWRKVNSSAPYHADAILNEEILEAISAYQCGDFENCMVELAQCGAVILRMMEYVAKEMK